MFGREGPHELQLRKGRLGSALARLERPSALAKAFDEAIHDQKVKERKRLDYGQRSGVYPYPTADGTRWRCRVKRSDGTWTNKRGFMIGELPIVGIDPNGRSPPM
jgi:hypothetical protein